MDQNLTPKNPMPNFWAIKFPESNKWYNYESSDCFEYPQKSLLKSSSPPQNPPKILRSSLSLEIWSTPWGKEEGKYVPHLNFKTYRFAYWGGPLVPVGMLLLYFCLPSSKFQSILCGLSRFHLPYVVILRPYCLFKFYPNSWQGLSITA